MKNFDRPYFSKNISEFWRRWHISLSTWFRDYLYIPLGGNRVSEYRRYFNLFFVFMMSGLWHGASWHFVIWGGLHGIYLIFGQLTKSIQDKILSILPSKFFKDFINVSITFVLVAFAWIFFAAHSNADSIYVVKNILKSNSHTLSQIIDLIGQNDLYLIIISVAILEFVQWQQRGNHIALKFENRPKWQRWCAYYLILMMILCFGVYNNSQFIYFQF
jgi:D-alanyl-lipoteichoic acid acyltransferase DltB (MBOAT superfamily)